MSSFQHHVFVCTNQRDESANRPSCGHAGSHKLRDTLKDAARAAGLKNTVRINAAGCLDQCEHGPVVVVYPENVWYGFVQLSDVQEIIQEHLINSRPVERLRLPETCLNTPACPHRK